MKTFAATLALFACQVSAFWGKGHLLVAREAEQILSKESPEVFTKALADLHELAQSHPDMIVNEKDHAFTECATFADDIKATFGRFQKNWHFINIPYLDEPGTTIDDFDFKEPSVDVVKALTDFTEFLKNENNTETSPYISRIAEEFPDLKDRRSFVLRMVIHYVGDIHQPLHAVAEVDSHYPKGDMGGNLHKIPDTTGSGVDNLHAVWDSVIYEFPGYMTMPFDTKEWTYYSTNAARILKEKKIDPEWIKSEQFSTWAQEDYAIARDYVYAGFEEGKVPSEEYKARALPKLEERMALGGRRLAELIKDIYGNSTALFLQ